MKFMRMNRCSILTIAFCFTVLFSSFPSQSIAQVYDKKNFDYIKSLKFFKVEDLKKVYVREMDCPLPLVWQFQVYNPNKKARLHVGTWDGAKFEKDKLGKSNAAPIVCPGDFILTLQIRPDQKKEGEWKCFAYITTPDFSEFVMVEVKSNAKLKAELENRTNSMEKYFENANRLRKSGKPHKELKKYDATAIAPLVLFKKKSSKPKDGKKGDKEKAKEKEKAELLAIWFQFSKE